MKRRIIFFIFLIVLSSTVLYGQGWQWASGCTGGAEGYGIAVDPWGNIYASGFAGQSLHFGGATLTDFGVCGTVVVKYSASGTFLWAKSTHEGYAKPINLASDGAGNLYCYGFYTSDHIIIDGYTLTNPGSGSELFLIKYSPSGTVLWAKNLCAGDPPGNIKSSGPDIFLTASFKEPVISAGATVLHNSDPAGITSDLLVLKMDTSGNFTGARSYGGPGNEVGYIALTKSGKIYLAGTATSPSITFGSTTLNNVDTSLFIVKFDPAFHVLWANNENGIGKIGSWVDDIATDSAENAFLCGSWRPTAYFGSQILPMDTTCNIYLAKFDSAGILDWVKQVTGNGQLGGFGVITDPCSNVWICGGMGDQTPGHHGSNYIQIDSIRIDTPSGSTDPMFIAEWSNSGSYIQTALLPTGGDDMVSIGSDGLGNIFISGDFWYGVYHIAGNTLYDPVQPSENIFVVKFQNGNPDTALTRSTICMSDSATLTVPPGYDYYIWGNGSRDSAITVHAPGVYPLYCTGRCGAPLQLDIFTVNYGKLDTVTAKIDTSICRNARAVLAGPTGYTSYLWSNGATTPTDTISAVGRYWAIAAGDCSTPTAIDTFDVTNNGLDLSFQLGNDTNVCAPLLLTAPLAGYHYFWQDGSTGSTDWANHPGRYFLTISAGNCFSSDSMNVYFPDLTQHLSDTILCYEHPAQVELTANVPPGASVLWSTGSNADLIWVNRAGRYWVSVTEDACTGADTMTVNEIYCTCNAVLPAAFTPNNDGHNDEFGPIIDKNCDVIDYTFRVFNRWGQLIFAAHHPSDKWTGEYNGVPQEIGTYMYFLQYSIGEVKNRHVMKGDVLLVR